MALHRPELNLVLGGSARDSQLGSGVNWSAEVRKLYAGAACPHFGIGEEDDGAMTLRYHSARRMCALAEGFIAGSAGYWCETVEVEHASCVERGDRHCEFRLRWIEAAGHARVA